MQNKGVIRTLTIVFALACLYELSFTFASQRVETKATEIANGDTKLRDAYLDSMMTETVYSLGLESTEFTYKEVKDREMNLGLDLRGGMSVILEVSTKEILRSLSNNSKDPLFNQALNITDSVYITSQSQYEVVFFQELDKLLAAEGKGRRYLDPGLFGTQTMNERLGINAGNDQIKEVIFTEVNGAVENVFTVLSARIDQFGVIQPNIQRLAGTGRIMVELPGVKDPDRVRNILQSTAELQFWKTYKGYEFMNFMIAANDRLRSIVEPPVGFEQSTGMADDSVETGDQGFVPGGIEPAEDDQNFVPGGIEPESDDSLNSETALEEGDSASADIAEADTANPFNPIFSIFGLNINTETGAPFPGPTIGFAAIKDTGTISKYLRMSQIRSMLPPEYRYVKFLWTRPSNDNPNVSTLVPIVGNRDNKPELEGDVIVDARQEFDQGNNPIVSMNMNGIGAGVWQRLTREQAALAATSPDKEPGHVAVVLDNLVYSAPRVNGEIAGGRTSIEGNFTIEEATDLATVLRAGKLPVPTDIVQSDVVGPTLGKEAVNSSMNAFILAFIIVMLYMFAYYGKAGLAANGALFANVIFIFGVLDALGAVLSLPGMAGIVLTIGMAVDSNVIIFERIREEKRAGKNTREALADGYKASYSAILDANITTLITAIILFVFGSGPIRGFATTLGIGIIASLFTSIFVARLFLEWIMGKKKDRAIRFESNFSKNWFTKVNINFIGKRKIAYVISGILIVLSLVSVFTKGMNFGVDFLGGRTYQVRFDQPVNTIEIGNSLAELFVDEDGRQNAPIVKTLGESSQIVVTTSWRVNEVGTETEKEIQQALYKGLNAFYADPITEEEFFSVDANPLGLIASRQVGPTIADDIKSDASLAVIFSLLAIFLYILIRFTRWQYSFGAVVSLVHDVIIVFGIFSLLDGIVPFNLEVDQAFIAAILTVIGYSLNDTVIILDRIREFFGIHKKWSNEDTINGAVNTTLSRTANTSFTTLVVLLTIFIFGGDSIRGFVFAIMVGVLVGTYSSVFLATPLIYETSKKKTLEEPDGKSK